MQSTHSGRDGLPSRTSRPLTVDDLFRVQHVRNPVFSPDGRWLAFEVTRPAGDSEAPGAIHRLTPFDQIHCDVWLAPVTDGAARNLTEGGKTGEGFWSPIWSPGGERLAMLCVREGRIRARVWDAATDALMPLGDMAVKHQHGLEGLAWLSERQIALIAWPPGSSEPSAIRAWTRPGEGAARRWPLAWSGAGCTGMALISGEGPWPASREAAHAQLWILDIKDGSRQLIDEGDLHTLIVSPDRQFLAYFKASPETPRMRPERPSPGMFGWAEYHLHLAGPQMPPRRVAAFQCPDMSTLAWSPNCTQLALLQQPEEGEGEEKASTLLRVSVPDGMYTSISRPDLSIQRFAWTAGDQLLVRTQPLLREVGEVDARRSDWWLVDGAWHNLTAGMEAVPEQLASTGAWLIGAADGHLWRIDPLGQRSPTSLRTRPEGEIRFGAWIGPTALQEGRQPILLVGMMQPGGEAMFVGRCGEDEIRLEVLQRPAAAKALSLPEAEAQGALVFPDGQTEVSPDGRTVAFTGEDQTGHFLWLARSGSPEPRPPLVALNTWTSQIAPPEIRELLYYSLNGQSLKALLLLPHGYEEGRRYPLIAWVYPQKVVQWRLIPSFTLPSPHTAQLLTARGYAVLIPSMPLPGSPCDPYLEMLNGVMPAVDQAVEMGIADPDRLGLHGHSGGGYAVYCLVTQTNRFRAAVASAGYTDLASAYGTVDAGGRYGDRDEPSIAIAYWSRFWEQGYGGMGAPPWSDAARYERNSPISYVYRVQTPLLMIHGDLDGVSVTQAEQFFTALYRQGKPACLLRYDGEEHLIGAEPNVRDMWSRIYEWFDYYLRSATAGGSER